MEDVFVGQVMSEPVVATNVGTPVATATERMVNENIGSIVVVDEQERPVGILTQTDVMKLVAEGEPRPMSRLKTGWQGR